MRQFFLNLCGHAAVMEAARVQHQAEVKTLRDELDSRRQRITELSEQFAYKSARLDAVQEQIGDATVRAYKAQDSENLVLRQMVDAERVRSRENKVFGVGPEPPEPKPFVMPQKTAPTQENEVKVEDLRTFTAWAAKTKDRPELDPHVAARLGISRESNGKSAPVVESAQHGTDAGTATTPAKSTS